jgi:cytidine deaminase
MDLPHPAALPLDDDDLALIETARDVLRRHHRPFWHTVAAALRSRDGQVWTGLHLGATVGRLSVCAEPIALGRAILQGDGSIAVAVAVRYPKPEEEDQSIAVVPPCGACREMLADYDPDALVIVPGLAKVRSRVLLPMPYRR